MNDTFKSDVKVHSKKNKEISKIERDKLNPNESFSDDGIESYELKRYLELKKEILSIKKIYQNRILVLGIAFIIIGVLLLTISIVSYSSIKSSSNGINLKDTATLQQEMNLIEKQLKIIADNQKILNQKVTTIYKGQIELSNKIDNSINIFNKSINDIYGYLKTEGKIIEVVSKIIMNSNIKLNKVIEKMYGNNTKIKKTINANNKAVKIQKEIKKETDNLLNKYKDLLKELNE